MVKTRLDLQSSFDPPNTLFKHLPLETFSPSKTRHFFQTTLPSLTLMHLTALNTCDDAVEFITHLGAIAGISKEISEDSKEKNFIYTILPAIVDTTDIVLKNSTGLILCCENMVAWTNLNIAEREGEEKDKDENNDKDYDPYIMLRDKAGGLLEVLLEIRGLFEEITYGNLSDAGFKGREWNEGEGHARVVQVGVFFIPQSSLISLSFMRFFTFHILTSIPYTLLFKAYIRTETDE